MLRWPLQPEQFLTPADRIRRAETLAACLTLPWRPGSGTNRIPPDIARRTARDDREFWQFRTYQPGDPLRGVDWKKSARGDELMLREHQRHDSRRVQIWLDRSPGMAFTSSTRTESKATAALMAALVMIRLLLRDGVQVTLTTPDGPQNVTDLAPADPLLTTGAPVLLADCLATLNGGEPLILISDFWTPWPQLGPQFERLADRRRDVLLIQVVDRAELDLSGQNGRVRFRSILKDQTELVESVADIRTAYRDRITAHETKLHKVCQSHDWTLIRHITDRLLTETLVEPGKNSRV